MQRRLSTQDITWFLDARRNNQLDLNPRYQRRSVWTLKDRRFFLDTIFSGYPCPAIFLHKKISGDGRATYDVVDGKQRLETIFMFADDKLAIHSEFRDRRLAGKKWRDINDADKTGFWNYVLPVEQLDFSDDETAVVEDAFDRLNRNSRKLERQELRHAKFDGWFATTVENESQEPFWRSIGLVTNARAKRMKDAQFLAELFIVLIEKHQFGFDQQHLDEMYGKYDDPDEEGVQLDTEDFTARLTGAKELLTVMNGHNGCVRSAAATVGAFYTLWALITLHRDALPDNVRLATNYADFTHLADQLRDQPNPNDMQMPQDRENWPELAFIYAQALRGAHTDLAPRDARLTNLLAAMRV